MNKNGLQRMTYQVLILDAYMQKVKSHKAVSACYTHKINTTICDVKIKTRGILLIVSNCGVIVSYREMYGSQSITQVANLYLYLDRTDIFKK